MKTKSINPLLRLAKRSACIALLFGVSTQVVYAGPLEQAKRMHDRLAGVPPSEDVLLQMTNFIRQNNPTAAAELAMENDHFYRTTLKNWAAPWTNRDQNVFVPLNDYIATVIGLTRDEADFRTLLYDDVIYVGNGVNPAYANNNNAHYEALETGTDGSGNPYSYTNRLERRLQSSVTGLPAEATAGVITSRAASKAFFIAGTNRAQFRFTLLNHLCRDLEQVHDITRVPDRIRQDVSRSPGGDARAFLNGCMGCHAGMDPLAQAFAYYDFIYDPETDLTGENGYLDYNAGGEQDPATGTRVKAKYHINSTTFPYGYVTPDDRWDNYWREGVNSLMGWDETLPGSGNGAKSMLQELAHSEAFAECQVEKVFEAVCLREPLNSVDRQQVGTMITNFESTNYRIKTVFADAANYCKGE